MTSDSRGKFGDGPRPMRHSGGDPLDAVRRVALVIGNSNYKSLRSLKNPINDARAIAKTLTNLGFVGLRQDFTIDSYRPGVTALEDLDQDALRKAFLAFGQYARGKDVAVIHFAGHGIAVDGLNYFIPIDITEFDPDTVDISMVSHLQAARAVNTVRQLGLVIIDACRDDPFEQATLTTISDRRATRGLITRPLEQLKGSTVVAYSAKHGQVAKDGSGEFSPYTAALLRHLPTPGLEINKLLGRVRDEVLTSTNGEQEPFTYGSRGADDIYLVSPQPPTQVLVGPIDDRIIEHTRWQNVRDSRDPGELEWFLSNHPAGIYHEDAERAWKRAVSECVDQTTLRHYLEFHGDNPRATTVKARLATIVWQAIEQTRDSTVVETFLQEFPDSTETGVARRRLSSLVWKKIRRSRETSVFEEFLGRFPESKEAADAKRQYDQISCPNRRRATWAIPIVLTMSAVSYGAPAYYNGWWPKQELASAASKLYSFLTGAPDVDAGRKEAEQQLNKANTRAELEAFLSRNLGFRDLEQNAKNKLAKVQAEANRKEAEQQLNKANTRAELEAFLSRNLGFRDLEQNAKNKLAKVQAEANRKEAEQQLNKANTRAELEAFLSRNWEFPDLAQKARDKLAEIAIDEQLSHPDASDVQVVTPQKVMWIKPGAKEKFSDCPSCPEMVVVPAGKFTMGSPDSEKGRRFNEDPQKQVTIGKPFAVSRFEITNAEWDACAAQGVCKPSNAPKSRQGYPVTGVSWFDARIYVAWLSKTTGKHYRLLSEAEWEYAARAGTTGPYWWGQSIVPTQANYDDSSAALFLAEDFGCSSGGVWMFSGHPARIEREKSSEQIKREESERVEREKSERRRCKDIDRKRAKALAEQNARNTTRGTVRVGSFASNPWGLFDMNGNVSEWGEDCGFFSYDKLPLDGSPIEGEACIRPARGGSWKNPSRFLRSAARKFINPGQREDDLGFRVARTLE